MLPTQCEIYKVALIEKYYVSTEQLAKFVSSSSGRYISHKG